MTIQKHLEELEIELPLQLFDQGVVLCNEAEYCQMVPIVKSGLLKVLRTNDQGQEILLYYLHPGECCIMSFLGTKSKYTSRLKAVVEEQAEVFMMPMEKAREMMIVNPAWMNFIFNQYNKRFDELLNFIEEATFKHLEDRIMELLKLSSENNGSNDIIITHQALAEELGTSKELVSRILKQMENSKLLLLAKEKISLYPSL